jgi:hypothetical protein
VKKLKAVIFDYFYVIGCNPKPFFAGAITAFIGSILGIIVAHIK